MLDTRDYQYFINVRHICGHWERHPFPEAAEPDVVEANLKSLKCSQCEKKERDGISARR